MLDFHAIRARHLQVYREYQQTRERILEPVRRSRAKIAGEKKVLLATQRVIENPVALLPADLLGRRVNLLI